MRVTEECEKATAAATQLLEENRRLQAIHETWEEWFGELKVQMAKTLAEQVAEMDKAGWKDLLAAVNKRHAEETRDILEDWWG